MTRPKTGRNDPCPCGSGKKYKKCCLKKESAAAPATPGAALKEANVKRMLGLSLHVGTSGLMMSSLLAGLVHAPSGNQRRM